MMQDSLGERISRISTHLEMIWNELNSTSHRECEANIFLNPNGFTLLRAENKSHPFE